MCCHVNLLDCLVVIDLPFIIACPTLQLTNKLFVLQHMKGNEAKLGIAIMLCYALDRLMRFSLNKTMINGIQKLFFSLVYVHPVRSLPFACMSGSMNKPTPLKLDVSLPSLKDLQWSFSRMIYLFNMQLERNVAT